MPWLKDIHSHKLDATLHFAEKGHVYTYIPTKERVRTSVSSVLRRYFDAFNATAVATNGVPKWAKDDSNKYHHLIRSLKLNFGYTTEQVVDFIVEYWRRNGEEAARKGTELHRSLELFLQDELPNPAPGEALPVGVAQYLKMRQWFFPDMHLVPWRVEFAIVLTATLDDGTVVPVVAGQIDAIFRDKLGRYWLIDWKTTDPQKVVLGRKGANARFVKKAKDMFSQFEADDFTKYSAQLHAYAWILKNGGYELPVAGLFLVQMSEKLERANVVEAMDLEEEVDAMMRTETDAALREAVAARAAPA